MRRRQSRGADAPQDRLAEPRFLRPRQDRRGAAAACSTSATAAGAASICATASRGCSISIDNSATGEVDGVDTRGLRQGRRRLHAVRHVLHDQMPLCAAASRSAVDFPHLMLRASRRRLPRGQALLVAAPAGRDRPQRHARRHGGAAGELGERRPATRLTRPVMEKRRRYRPPRRAAEIPRPQLRRSAPNRHARARCRRRPRASRKAVLYATCFVNYNNPRIGEAARAVLARNGVETEVVYPALLRHAAARAGRPRRASPSTRATVAAALGAYIDRGLRRGRADRRPAR